MSDHALYICTKFHKNTCTSNGLKVIEPTPFPYCSYQGDIISSKCRWIPYLFSAHYLMMLYICTKSHENISEGFRVN